MGFFWIEIHSKLNKFRIKKLDCYIVSDFRFLLEIQAILLETSPFLSAQMAVLSSFLKMFRLLGRYNFGKLESVVKFFEYLWAIYQFPSVSYMHFWNTIVVCLFIYCDLI